MKGGMLKPCEMSDKKVIDFVLHAEPNYAIIATIIMKDTECKNVKK